MSDWISVALRLPELITSSDGSCRKSNPVLVWTGESQWLAILYDDLKRQQWVDADEMIPINVTHWMPSPNPPGET